MPMKFALTHPFSCNYLPEQDEQLIVLSEQHALNPLNYDALLNAGFRRSGEHVYRPHCPQCSACQSLRIPVASFQPSRGQKRIAKTAHGITHSLSYQDQPNYYPLYERYIEARHADGSMYPPSKEQYQQFIQAPWGSPLFVELWQAQQLVAVAITDQTQYALSALYTYFAPELAHLSLGTLAILRQIEIAQALGKQHLYLGYQIDACSKMNYKAKFFPHEKFIQGNWYRIDSGR
ncbi:putative arginyl-tRNA--protein transferase [Bowmanella pacifica]|uniref:Aspartate/glutamate leucyltransferase n=2 Tax=Bowmanella pacifica TaxID=502051 RepID=A0A917Z1L3_9ALTE|nr:putative arginyl-tRNA--protein transferase [Bowmanella pacifica]